MNTSTQPLTLNKVKQEFDDWRCQRGKVGSFPDELWRATVDLLDHHSSAEIIRELRITKGQLEDRKQRYRPTEISKDQFIDLGTTNNILSNPIDDVKVTQQSLSPLLTSSIELRKPDGTTLTIHELHQTEVKALITTFME